MYIKAFKIRRKIVTVSIVMLTVLISFISFAGSIKTDEREVLILMYHHILKDTSYHGKYVVSPSQFEEDLIFLKENGYETVLIKDLVDFVYNKNKLPQKCVVISFDDGHLSNFHYIFPLIKKTNDKIVISIVGEYTDTATKTEDRNVAYSYLKWEDIKELNDSGLVEIANHTYNFHIQGKRVGIGSIKGETKEEYTKIITSDLIKLNKKIKDITGKEPVTFTYPFGKAVENSYDVIKDVGFLASLSCEEGINVIMENDKDCLYMLKRYNRPSGISTKDFFEKIMPDL